MHAQELFCVLDEYCQSLLASQLVESLVFLSLALRKTLQMCLVSTRKVLLPQIEILFTQGWVMGYSQELGGLLDAYWLVLWDSSLADSV